MFDFDFFNKLKYIYLNCLIFFYTLYAVLICNKHCFVYFLNIYERYISYIFMHINPGPGHKYDIL
jgi:hypothetical protein